MAKVTQHQYSLPPEVAPHRVAFCYSQQQRPIILVHGLELSTLIELDDCYVPVEYMLAVGVICMTNYLNRCILAVVVS
jgi:hypothetical protein